jgi:type IX secretion system PorP/SprF family membrane protein
MEKIKTTYLKLRSIVFVGIMMHTLVFGQDANFSQFYNNPTYYNPSMTAINGGYTVRLHARNLWAPIPGRFNTYTASFEAEVLPRVGVGIIGFSDVGGEGLLRTVSGMLSYAYRAVDTKNFTLQAGINGGIVSKYVDWDQFTFSDQLHEVQGEVRQTSFIAPNSNNVLYADFGAGISTRFNHLSKKTGPYRQLMATIGFGIHHLSKPSDAFIIGYEYLPIKYTGHAKLDILLGTYVLSPAVIYEHQNRFQTFSIGMSVQVKPINLGVWFRNRNYGFALKNYDSFTFAMGTFLPIKNERDIKITYSIDFTISKLRAASFGSHELSLVMNFNNRYMLKGRHMRQKTRSTFKCPADFMGTR